MNGWKNKIHILSYLGILEIKFAIYSLMHNLILFSSLCKVTQEQEQEQLAVFYIDHAFAVKSLEANSSKATFAFTRSQGQTN